MENVTARTMVLQVIAGLDHLYRRDIGHVHRDLSADNVLVDIDVTGEPRYVVTDLGMCTMCPRRDKIPADIKDDQLSPLSFKCVPRNAKHVESVILWLRKFPPEMTRRSL